MKTALPDQRKGPRTVPCSTDSLQGIELNKAPAFGFQGHPEASPGPHDIAGLFDRFIDNIKTAKTADNVTVLRKA